MKPDLPPPKFLSKFDELTWERGKNKKLIIKKSTTQINCVVVNIYLLQQKNKNYAG